MDPDEMDSSAPELTEFHVNLGLRLADDAQMVSDFAGAQLCFICQKSSKDDNRLKQICEKTWPTIKNVASLRNKLTTDQFSDVTHKIVENSVQRRYSSLRYHTPCYRHYTAVKRPASSSPDASNKVAKVETRRSSSLPKSDKQGILTGTCIFCGRSRKVVRRKEEPRLKIATINGFQSLYERAERSSNDRIKSLARIDADLIAKGAEYHKSCRVQFYKETEDSKTACGVYHHHKNAFSSLCAFIEAEIVDGNQPMKASDLLEIYKLHYNDSGGNMKDVDGYKLQNLVGKIREKFGERISISLLDRRRGNFLYNSNMTCEDARASLHDDANEKIKWAALYLRSQILKFPKSRTPSPTTVSNLKECAPKIPHQLDIFFRCLLSGVKQQCRDKDSETLNRKVTAMASDAIYNVTHGAVKPWKHTVMGLGLASLTGSKQAVQILNREGHCINYSAVKGLETEVAYSVGSDGCDTPDGIYREPSLATASVWDNNDAYVETLDGKDTLHCTVGHTYQNVFHDDTLQQPDSNPPGRQFQCGRNRKVFIGKEREIPPFRKSLNKAQFQSAKANQTGEATSAISPLSSQSLPERRNDGGDCGKHTPSLSAMDLYWFYKLKEGNQPLHAGFVSQYVKDPLPLQRICYMDPISSSPANNDVVRETMIRTMNVANETGQDYGVVTYDLAIATKAYSIQALLIMLGNFHIELAFYGAVGTFINECGIEFILTESQVLAEKSIMGFVKGKFFNRCKRIHELLANVFEQKLYERFLTELTVEEQESFQLVMDTVPSDPTKVEAHLSDQHVIQHLAKYEAFLQSFLEGKHGPTSQYWAIYIFLINRLHRELRRCVNTNDVAGYVAVFPKLLDVFYALNRPNYARWGTLFLNKLENADPKLREVLDKGAFSIRRTKIDYSRSAVDLSLEQTVNRDAVSQMKGIVAFRNSENAMRRWSLTMAQRAMAVTELKTFAGIHPEENAANQCRQYRIQRDNSQMARLSSKINEFCNPFSDEKPNFLVNLATGRAASKPTEAYLLNTLTRGEKARKQFQCEWDNDSNRFQKPVKRVKVQNFASEGIKKKPLSEVAKKSAEGLRDMFIRMIIVVSQNTSFDLRKILSYPITEYPLSLAHCDGTRVKTDKSTLLKKLESFQNETVTESELPKSFVAVYDGGLVLHSTLSQTKSGTSFASISRKILSAVCSNKAREVHLCLDKYVQNSIKDSERRMRDAVDCAYVITGPEQTIKQNGKNLLNNGVFKNEVSKFLLKEWQKGHYCDILGGKVLFASYGGECFQYSPGDTQGTITVTKPPHLQGDHEEADSLIAYHVANITSDIIVRASDTDVLVILIGAIAYSPERSSEIFMDCGMGNQRRYIKVSSIVANLEKNKPGLAKALPGYHTFTGCDFTSGFYRKGKVKPLDLITSDGTNSFLNFFIGMGDKDTDVELDIASRFVCRMYGQTKTCDVNEGRYNKLIQMSGNIKQENPLANVKRIDCALLPPSRKSLAKHLLRVHYTAILWTRASSACPGSGLSPIDYGWHMTDKLEPVWFDGPPVPQTLFKDSSANFEEPGKFSDDESEQGDSWSDSDSTWTEDSSSDED